LVYLPSSARRLGSAPPRAGRPPEKIFAAAQVPKELVLQRGLSYPKETFDSGVRILDSGRIVGTNLRPRDRPENFCYRFVGCSACCSVWLLGLAGAKTSEANGNEESSVRASGGGELCDEFHGRGRLELLRRPSPGRPCVPGKSYNQYQAQLQRSRHWLGSAD
jgi:hypothetical protein